MRVYPVVLSVGKPLLEVLDKGREGSQYERTLHNKGTLLSWYSFKLSMFLLLKE